MAVPIIVFIILMFTCSEELGFKGVIISLAIWLGLMSGMYITTGKWPYFFIAGNALLDIVLILIIFGRDIDIPLR